MKICVTCVYWMLLFISVVSSALLFIIVASESAQTNYYSSLKRNETSEIYDNDTLDKIKDKFQSSRIKIIKLQDPENFEIENKDYLYHEKFSIESAKFETAVHNDITKKGNSYKEPDLVAESLIQQPNLSQGISEVEHTTVLTLSDTATAELQNLADPKISVKFSEAEIFAQDSSQLTKNVSIEQTAKQEQQKILPSTQIPPSSINEIGEKPNDGILEENKFVLPESANEGSPEVVVVVRAEQSPIITDGSEFKLEGEDIVKIPSDDIPKVDGVFTTVPELNDTEDKTLGVDSAKNDAANIVLNEGVVPIRSTNSHEDIPSFNEWTQKRLEEAEKKKTHPNASIQNAGTPIRSIGGMKMRSKNYASPDCGAKIVAANPEARSARSVLVSTRDEYMLNTCTSRIWFVVELCEAIQAKKIELANFELFSSSPKDFSVYISDRFPTRDWSLVGQFTAKDVKDIQSFALQPYLFGKFIKIELQSHHGYEHFCPISLFRAYGTSEFEVLETETENQVSRETNTNVEDEEDSDEEEPLDVENGEPPRNLFGSARDAVLSIVKKAAEVLVKSSELTGNNITKIEQSLDNGNILKSSLNTCTTPRYTILCDNCSYKKFAKVFQIVSCKGRQLNRLLETTFVNNTLRNTDLCRINGVKTESSVKKDTDEITKQTQGSMKKYDRTNEVFDSVKNIQMAFLSSIFKSEYIVALCNILAIKERKVVMNSSQEIPLNNSIDTGKEDASRKDGEDCNGNTIKSFQHTPATSTSGSNADNNKPQSSPQGHERKFQEVSNEEIEKNIDTSTESPPNSEHIALQTEPSKTLDKDETKNNSSVPVPEVGKDIVTETIQPEMLTTVPVTSNIGHYPEESSVASGSSTENLPQTITPAPVTTIDNNSLSNDSVAPNIDPLEFSSSQKKVEKVERPDSEGKQDQEVLDQDIKQLHQDTFDTFLSDLKDLEGEATQIQNGPVASASATQSTANTMPQKESVFLRLSNRIKALERNMSLSGQYLEELSRRYKKQVEEMQRSLERTVATMSEETRKREERESKRAEEIALLREEIAGLSKSVKNLLYDRDSWRGKFSVIGQHVILICSEILLIFLFLSYCRGNKRSQNPQKNQMKKDTIRRKSAENFGSHVKKTKKRRPSEIASHITGTYGELMIDDRFHETKKERKKKRKKEIMLSSNKTVGNDDARTGSNVRYTVAMTTSASDAAVSKYSSPVEVLQIGDTTKQFQKVLVSKSDIATAWPSDYKHETEYRVPVATLRDGNTFETVSMNSSEYLDESSLLLGNAQHRRVTSSEQIVVESMKDTSNSKSVSGILKDRRLSATSSFMRTALSTRKKRNISNDVNGQWSKKSGDTDDNSVRIGSTDSNLYPDEFANCDDTTTNGLSLDQSDESRSSSITSMSKKKEKSRTSFRKMVRKFF